MRILRILNHHYQARPGTPAATFFGRGQAAIIGRRAARATGFLFYCRPEEEKYETLIMRRILLYVKLYCALFFTNALSCINSTPLSKLLQPVTMCSTHCSGDAK